jgi:chromosome segregation ATPase
MPILSSGPSLLSEDDFENPEELKARVPRRWEAATEGTVYGRDYSKAREEHHERVVETAKKALRERDEEITARKERKEELRSGELYNHDAVEELREAQERLAEVREKVKAERKSLSSLRQKREALKDRLFEARVSEKVADVFDEAETESAPDLESKIEEVEAELAETEAFVDKASEIEDEAAARVREAREEALSVAEEMAAGVLEQQVELLRRVMETQETLSRLAEEASMAGLGLGQVGFTKALEGKIELFESFIKDAKADE